MLAATPAVVTRTAVHALITFAYAAMHRAVDPGWGLPGATGARARGANSEGDISRILEVRPAGRENGRVLTLLPRAAELYRDQIEQGLGGDPAAAAKARIILWEMPGEIMLSPGEDGSLWAEYAMQPGALLTAGTGGRGEGICHVPALPIRVRLK